MNINDPNIIEITEELSSEYEISKVLRKYPKDTVIIKNPKGFDIPIVCGICNTREKIAKSINCEVSEITQKIIDTLPCSTWIWVFPSTTSPPSARISSGHSTAVPFAVP